MATVNTCDVPGCAAVARKVRVSIDTFNDKNEPVGVAMEMDACDAHRIKAYDTLQVLCIDALESSMKG